MHWRRWGSFSLVVFGILIFSCACLWFFLTLPPLPEGSEKSSIATSSQEVVRGAIHIHTNRSDGHGSVEEIALAASDAGLDFVIFTDHGTGHETTEPPRFIENVLCIDAVEISTDSGHLIAIGLPPSTPYPLGGDSRGVVDDVRRLGALGVAAHPFSPKLDLQWTDSISELDGIEILNGDSQWRDEDFVQLFVTSVHSLFRPAASFARLLDRSNKTFKYWDSLGERNRTVGLSGADIHGQIPLTTAPQEGEHGTGIGLPFPKYKDVFSTFSNRVILHKKFSKDPTIAAASLVSSLKEGRLFTVMDGVAEFRHFSFTAKKAGEVYQMGEVVASDGEIVFQSEVAGPDALELVLYKDGIPVAQTKTKSLRYSAAPDGSVYRVEVFLLRDRGNTGNPWLMSNPIYVGDYINKEPQSTGKRTPVNSFSANDWHLEHSADESTGSVESNDALLNFHYALDGQSESDSFVAAAYINKKFDLKGATEISFDVIGDRPMRLLLQLRAGSLEKEPRWIQSFYADSNKRNISIALDSLRPAEASQSPSVLVDVVDSLLFVADLTNHSPGDSALVQISNIHTVRVE